MSHLPRPARYLIRNTKLQHEYLGRRVAVLTVMLVATLAVLLLAFLDVLLGFVTGAVHAPINRLTSIAAALTVCAALYVCLRRGRYAIAAYGVIGIYGALATVAAVQWGINLPAVSLLYCIVIVLAGIVLGALYSLYAAAVSAAILLVVELAIVHGKISPNVSWYHSSPHLNDLATYFLVFLVLGVCSWLFNRQTDLALHRALSAERALQHERDTLEIEVEARTRELQAAQIETMGQLYRFAELGQLATGLLHDLANHMGTLSLDIEGMAQRQRHSQLELRVKQRIGHIDNIVRWAYEHINGEDHSRVFGVKHEVGVVIELLNYRARRARVRLRCSARSRAPLQLYGDPNRFRQLMTNLITNAIDAYETAPRPKRREVAIDLAAGENGAVIISVSDYGVGISGTLRKQIFQPFYSTKHDGMGIGLFVVKQIAEEHFRGSIQLTSGRGTTCFTLNLTGAMHAD